MAIAAMIPLALQFGPPLIEAAVKLYRTLAAAPETPAEQAAHYARIAEALEQANALVQSTPEPPAGSGA